MCKPPIFWSSHLFNIYYRPRFSTQHSLSPNSTLRCRYSAQPRRAMHKSTFHRRYTAQPRRNHKSTLPTEALTYQPSHSLLERSKSRGSSIGRSINLLYIDRKFSRASWISPELSELVKQSYDDLNTKFCYCYRDSACPWHNQANRGSSIRTFR
jgi:hypothetical protein